MWGVKGEGRQKSRTVPKFWLWVTECQHELKGRKSRIQGVYETTGWGENKENGRDVWWGQTGERSQLVVVESQSVVTARDAEAHARERRGGEMPGLEPLGTRAARGNRESHLSVCSVMTWVKERKSKSLSTRRPRRQGKIKPGERRTRSPRQLAAHWGCVCATGTVLEPGFSIHPTIPSTIYS